MNRILIIIAGEFVRSQVSSYQYVLIFVKKAMVCQQILEAFWTNVRLLHNIESLLNYACRLMCLMLIIVTILYTHDISKLYLSQDCKAPTTPFLPLFSQLLNLKEEVVNHASTSGNGIKVGDAGAETEKCTRGPFL